MDMKGVLALIKELAIFEKEPEAVVITEEDLIRDGFGENPLFSVFVAEKEQQKENVQTTTHSKKSESYMKKRKMLKYEIIVYT